MISHLRIFEERQYWRGTGRAFYLLVFSYSYIVSPGILAGIRLCERPETLYGRGF